MEQEKMNAKPQPAFAPDGKWLYRLGGLAALVLVAGYGLTFPVYASVGYWPAGAEARLAYFASHAQGWWLLTGLMVFTDLLYLPVFLALYHALKAVNKSALLLAFAFEGLFVALDLAITWTTHSSLLTLGSQYASAGDAERAILVAAAGYPSAMLDSPLLGLYIILIPSIGLLLAALAMSTGSFGKVAAGLGWAAGLSGVVAAVGPRFFSALGFMPILNAVLVMIWFLVVGLRLLRLGLQKR